MSQIYFSSSSYPRKIAANVCVSAAVRFRSRVLAHADERNIKNKTSNQHFAPSWHRHSVSGCGIITRH